MANRVVVVFRYDDYHARLGPETERKAEIERRFLEAFAARETPLTLGVVPNYEGRRLLADDSASLDALRGLVSAGRAEAALHGLTHQSLAPQGARSSEFAGQPQAQQAERLRTGKAMLEEWLAAPVTSFIPPWNSFDAATVAALAETGFATLSAALSEPAVPPPIVALPHTCGLPQLRRAVRGLRRKRGHSTFRGEELNVPFPASAIIVCTFHEFSFRESTHPLARRYGRLSLAELGELLAWCRGQDGIECATLGQAARECREALLDGRVDEARELWGLLLRLRRVPVVGRAARWLWTPLALAQPGWHGRALRRARRLARLFGKM